MTNYVYRDFILRCEQPGEQNAAYTVTTVDGNYPTASTLGTLARFLDEVLYSEFGAIHPDREWYFYEPEDMPYDEFDGSQRWLQDGS